jgi:hypothetical protein
MPTGKNIFYGNIKSPPVWAGDFGGREHVMPFPAKIDASQFTDGAGITVTLSAGASGSATSLTVTALTLPQTPVNTLIGTSQGLVLIPSGTVLDFGGQKFARLTADAKLGDTTLTVAALVTALSSGDSAVYSKYGTEYIPSGTVVGRTYVERDANTAFGAAAVTDDEIYLSLFDVTDAKNNDDVELYRHGSLVKENYLPNYTTLSTAVDEVQTLNWTNSPAGTFRIGVVDKDGKVQYTQRITYSGTAATLVSNINTALDAITASSAIVAAGSAVTAITLTFSGTNYTGKAQTLVTIDGDALTAGDVDVTRTTAGGTPLLTKLRSLYRCIKGV